MSDFSDDETPFEKTSIIQSDTFKVRLAQAGQAPPCFVLLVGPSNQVGRQWPIEKTDFVIGRSAGSNIHVDDKSVSKSHAKLQLKAGEVSVTDLESTNKTIVNGRQITALEPLILKNNDQIKMGNVIFKFLERGNIETVSVAQTFDRGQIDALTQIYNRGALNAMGTENFSRARMLGANYSVLVFDIDFFKKVNDNYGHAAGDFVLKELSKVIREGLIRGNDIFGRYGGEEFCLLLVGSETQKVMEIGERLRKTIEEHKFEFENQVLPITISVGISSIKDSDEGWNDIFVRADKALYASKEGGRNQVNFQD